MVDKINFIDYRDLLAVLVAPEKPGICLEFLSVNYPFHLC